MEELETLADEIRQEIIKTVSENGGHLASPLGAVEIILAVLKNFEPPRDRIIFDVGHQAYAYKILTGRKEFFHTLKTWGGIAGYLKREESVFDFFGAGHASTSISSGLGMSEAMKLKGEEGKVIIIIGDGAITAGMSYEAMNNTGELRSNIMVILNDNGMSISQNKGAISSLLSRKFASPKFWHLRQGVKNFLKRTFPKKGEKLIRKIRHAEDSFMSFVTPGIVFEGLGFYYFGPIDGHNIKHLVEIFAKLKEWRGPVFVHIKTRKGKGYLPAERDPERFHGVSAFEISTGEQKKKSLTPSFSNIFGDYLCKLAERDERIIAVTAAMPTGTGLEDFRKKYPKRFYDVGIAEQHAVTFSAGLTLEGFCVYTAIYSTFLQRAYDQIIHDICIQDIPVKLCIDRAGLVGEDGQTHHGTFDISFLRPLPNMVLMAPSDENELRDMLLTSLDIEHPCAIRYPRGNAFGYPEREPEKIKLGEAKIIKEGNDILIINYGMLLKECKEAADEIEKEFGVKIGLLNARFAKPLDEEKILGLASVTKKVLTVEEGAINGGFGSAVLELLSGLRAKVVRIGIPDTFVEHGARDILLKVVGLDKESIKTSIMKLLED